MFRNINSLILLLMFSILSETLYAQSIQLSETIIISGSSLIKEENPETIKNFFIREVYPAWQSGLPGTKLYLLQADRGVGKDNFMLVCIPENGNWHNQDLPEGSPFTDEIFSRLGPLSSQPSYFLSEPKKFTKYRLIGAEGIASLPSVDILGIHYIQVGDDKTETFERFVKEQLHPELSELLPDMGLFYYKAVEGENSGSYITIFAIKSVKAREKFWPTGGLETEVVKNAFLPLNDLARKLGTYLVEGTYLLPESGGAAAYFESLKWTDFVLVK